MIITVKQRLEKIGYEFTESDDFILNFLILNNVKNQIVQKRPVLAHFTQKKEHRRSDAPFFESGNYFTAIHSTSSFAPFGIAATCTQLRAG